MIAKKGRSLLLGASALLLPLTLSNSPAPAYYVITEAYAPSASVQIIDDSLSDYATVEVRLYNGTDNLIHLTDFYLASEEAVLSDQSDGRNTSYIYYWQDGFGALKQNLYLAPKSHYLPRYLALPKQDANSYTHYAETYQALKEGKTLHYGFEGTVYSANLLVKDKDYSATDLSLSTSYDAENDKTVLAFSNTITMSSGTIDSRFYRFDYEGINYQAPGYNDLDDSETPWLKGSHQSSEIRNWDCNLYTKGSTLFSSETNARNKGFSFNAWPFISTLLTVVFVLLGIGTIIALILLLVFLSKKKKQNNKPAQ